MTLQRKPSEWDVQIQGPDGVTKTEKVFSFWSPDFEGIKESISLAARCQAWLRTKKNAQFQALGEPKLVTRGA